MTGILTPSFHVYYSKQLNQLPRSIKIDTWRRLTSRKHPLSLEQASSIHPEVEDLLNKAVENYIKQKERQKRAPEYATILLVNLLQTKVTSVQTNFTNLYVKLQVLYLSVHRTFLLKITFPYTKLFGNAIFVQGTTKKKF